jgi:mannose-6-phosphate isomerase-like protein (cupin superfamily)
MSIQDAIIIRQADKKGMQTPNSRYMFHLSSYPVQGSIGFFEGHFKEPVMKYNLHYHKILTEIFTVTKGEFYFILGDEEFIFSEGDSAIIPPLTVHGFKSKTPDSKLHFIFTNTEDREGFFNGLARIINGEIGLNDEKLEAFFNRYDQYSVKRSDI